MGLVAVWHSNGTLQAYPEKFINRIDTWRIMLCDCEDVVSSISPEIIEVFWILQEISWKEIGDDYHNLGKGIKKGMDKSLSQYLDEIFNENPQQYAMCCVASTYLGCKYIIRMLLTHLLKKIQNEKYCKVKVILDDIYGSSGYI